MLLYDHLKIKMDKMFDLDRQMLIYVVEILYHYFYIIKFLHWFYQIIFDIHQVHLKFHQMVLHVKANILFDQLMLLDHLPVMFLIYQQMLSDVH